jgi:hypothetical protein
MDGAEAGRLDAAGWFSTGEDYNQPCRRAWRSLGSSRANESAEAASADLGGSSKYSNENFED